MTLESLGFQLERIPDEHDSSDTRLVLRDLNDPKMLPLAVDFLSAQIKYRRQHGAGKSQPFAKALGIRSAKEAPYVFDATAGLGVDAFMMACMGCRVRAVEQSPFVFALLEDGYRRLQEKAIRHSEVEGKNDLLEIVDRLSFEQGSAEQILAGLGESERPDVVYLDPMYPEDGRSKSALPKKGMQIFRRLIGHDHDGSEAFAAAMKVARLRVVVKRPLHAPYLGAPPTHSFSGKTARFDMVIAGR